MNTYLLILIVSFIFPINAFAACITYEYAEIKDMNKQELTNEYCKNLRVADGAMDRSIELTEIKMVNEAVFCLEQNKRLERVLLHKFKITASCPEKSKWFEKELKNK